MRHLRDLASIEVSLLPGRMMRPTFLGPLVPPPSGAHRLTSAERRAAPGAVPIAVVAPPAQEKHLTAPRTCHNSKRLHAKSLAISTWSSRAAPMARGKNKRPTQTFQQRQTQLHQRDAKDRAVVEDIPTRFTCSNAIARDFAGQCEERIEDLEFDRPGTGVAFEVLRRHGKEALARESMVDDGARIALLEPNAGSAQSGASHGRWM